MTTPFAAMLLCLAANAYAQSQARLSGRVLDQTGAALPGVTIDLVVNSRQWTTSTNEAGAAASGSVTSDRVR